MSSKKNGKCIIVSAPSGAGKTTIVHHLMSVIPELGFSVSATNRSPRPNEVDGSDYVFLSTSEFKSRIKADDFVEWEEVYEEQFYGTLKKSLWRPGLGSIYRTSHSPRAGSQTAKKRN